MRSVMNYGQAVKPRTVVFVSRKMCEKERDRALRFDTVNERGVGLAINCLPLTF